jgi:dynein heavy chain
LINFAIRETGLEKQLLDEIFKLEEPKLEEEKVKLIKNIEEDKSKQITTENEILTMLSKSEANLLEDDVLIEKLRKSKTNSDKVQDRLEKTEATMKKIENGKEVYRKSAKLAAVI